jgi:TPR repeat protein
VRRLFCRGGESPARPPAIEDAAPAKALQDKIAALEKQVEEEARRRAEEERKAREEAERRQRLAAEAERARAEEAKRETEERARAAAARRAEEEASRRAPRPAPRGKPEAKSEPAEPPKPAPPTAAQVIAQADETAARGNFGDAAALLRPLAERNDPGAQFRLSQLYLEGRGVAPDPKEGLRLLEGAATQGHRDARLALGGMYAAGRGVRPNANVAYIWYGAAACAGSARAKTEQETIRPRLQPAEIQQAEKLIADLCKRG